MANLILKSEIIRQYGSQLAFSKASMVVGELRLSKIIHGRARPTHEEVEVMAKMLKLPAAEIFPDEEGVAQ